MAKNWTEYQSRAVLLDVTIPSLAEGATIQSPTTGSRTVSSSVAQVSNNSILSTAVDRGYVADATIVEIIPPLDSAGNPVDCAITFTNGKTNLEDTIMIDGSAGGNMFPRALVTVGSKQVRLGYSIREVVAKGSRNMPMLITGIKITDSLTIRVSSVAGWGVNGTAVTPLRVIVKGDVYGTDEINSLTSFYNPTVSLNYPPAGAVSFIHEGILTASTFGTLPGGDKQKSIRINRRFTYAYNNQATVGNSMYVFSQQQSLQGNEQNVVDQQHDLGDDFTGTQNLFLWQELGIRLASGISATAGLRADGVIVPQDTQFGTPLSYHVNDFQYGDAQPQRSNSGEYFAMPSSSLLAKMLVEDNGVAPFIVTTASVDANQISMAKGGVLIQRS